MIEYETNGKLHVDKRLIWDYTRWNEFLVDERSGRSPMINNVVLAGVAGIFEDYNGLIAQFRYEIEPEHPNRVWGILPSTGEVLGFIPRIEDLQYKSFLHYAGHIYIDGKEIV